MQNGDYWTIFDNDHDWTSNFSIISLVYIILKLWNMPVYWPALQWCLKWPHSARVTAACVSEVNCIPAAYCGMSWLSNGIYRLDGSVCALNTDCSDIFSVLIRTMNIVGVFGNFWEVGRLIKLLKNTLQGSAATVYRLDGQVYKFRCKVYSGCQIPKLIKSVDASHSY